MQINENKLYKLRFNIKPKTIFNKKTPVKLQPGLNIRTKKILINNLFDQHHSLYVAEFSGFQLIEIRSA